MGMRGLMGVITLVASVCAGCSSDDADVPASMNTSDAGTSAAGAGSGGAARAGRGGASAPVFQQGWLACDVAQDCVVVPSNGCCGCSDVAVNRRYQTEARAALNSTNLAQCGPVGCATEGCHADARGGCNAGSCVALPGCSERQATTEDCEADGTCALYSARLCQNASAAPFSLCATPLESAACDPGPACRVNPGNGVMLLFADGCVPPGWMQECPVACQ